jgi:hypothetical protein
MNRNLGSGGPKSGPENKDINPDTKLQKAPETSDVKKTPEELKLEAAKKRDAGKDAVKKETKSKLEGLALGGDFGLLMKKFFNKFGKFLSSFDGISDKVGNIFAAQSPEEVDRICNESKNLKIPKIENPESKVTTIEEPNPEEKLLIYLYRCLKIAVPTKENIKPSKKLTMQHLMLQLWRTYPFAKGKKEIMAGFTQKPEKFHKDDIVFFRNGMTGNITSGFIQEIGEHTIKVTTLDETGTKRTIPMYKNMCLMAFQIPGNKSKSVVPVKKKKKKEFKFGEKNDKKPDQKDGQNE